MPENRVVVITGSAGGMGRLLVDRFANNGDIVVATDVKQEPLDKLRSQFEGRATVVAVAADISSERDCQRIADVARDKAGRVDVLINCAGFFPMKPFEEITLEEWRRVIDINLTSVFLLTKAVLPLMKGRGWGRIVNISSASIFEGVADQTHYVAAKAGVIGLSRSLARAFGKHGITVNVVTPGLTVTPPVKEKMPAQLLEAQIASRAIPREERPEDLVGAVFFLASRDADFVSGQTINVDGGKHML